MKTERQKDALRLIYDHFKKHGEYPSNIQMAKMLGISPNQWGNTRRLMVSHNKLSESVTGDFELQADVFESLRQKEEQAGKLKSTEEQPKPAIQLPLPAKTVIEKPKPSKQIKSDVKSDVRFPALGITPINIPILGEVQAGTNLGPDDLRVYLSPSEEPLTIPDIEIGQEVFALEVTGESMVSDNILPQDFIVVEKVGIGQIKPQDLIVAKYLQTKYNTASKAKVDAIRNNEDYYDGPTLKYLIKKEDGIGYTLAPNNRDPKYTIFTRDLMENNLGRVVAVHRTIRRL